MDPEKKKFWLTELRGWIDTLVNIAKVGAILYGIHKGVDLTKYFASRHLARPETMQASPGFGVPDLMRKDWVVVPSEKRPGP